MKIITVDFFVKTARVIFEARANSFHFWEQFGDFGDSAGVEQKRHVLVEC